MAFGNGWAVLPARPLWIASLPKITWCYRWPVSVVHFFIKKEPSNCLPITSNLIFQAFKPSSFVKVETDMNSIMFALFIRG
jgi:hypothetical protein